MLGAVHLLGTPHGMPPQWVCVRYSVDDFNQACCRNAQVLTLKAAAALWVLSLLGRLLSVWRLLALAFVVAFTVPAAIDANRHRLQKVWHDGSRAVQVICPFSMG